LKPHELYSKAIDEALSLMKADLDILRKHRGGKFLIKDVRPYLDVVDKMESTEEQEEAVFFLHKDSVRNHYEILNELTKTLAQQDEPYIEHFQTPALMEILYERDPEFREFVEKFILEIGNSKDIISKESIRKYSGFYGPTCALDLALTPGSTGYVLNQIIERMNLSKKEKYYAQTVLASKSWGLNTAYAFGWKFIEKIEDGKSAAEAVEEEIKNLQMMFDHPMETQKKLMDDVGFSSFNSGQYLEKYKKRMQKTVEDSLDRGVHYANILMIPSLSIGDIGHHLSQSLYDLFEDWLALEIVDAIVEVVEKTLKRNIDKYKNLSQILHIATGSAAASITSILESEGFTSGMIIKLLTERFQNFIQKYPYRGVGLEFHNVDFMEAVYRGDRILHRDNGKIDGIRVELSPLKERGIIRDFRSGCIYPNCGFTSRFSVLMKFSDHFCLPNIEPMSVALITNIVSLRPEKPMTLERRCKQCAVSSVLPFRCEHYKEKEHAL